MLKNLHFFRQNENINQRLQWGRHGYCLTNKHESLHKWCVNAGRFSAKLMHHQASIVSAPRVWWGIIFNGLRKERLFPVYRQRVALFSAYRQRIGDISSVAAAKLSVSARHAKNAWLEPWDKRLWSYQGDKVLIWRKRNKDGCHDPNIWQNFLKNWCSLGINTCIQLVGEPRHF